MIVGIGIDIIEIARIKKAIQNERFVTRVFTPWEIAYCQSRGIQAAASYAARFAAKEAVLKAFGTGLRGGSLRDIEILPDALGCPKVNLSGYYLKRRKMLQVDEIHLSLSHARDYAVAEAIFWRG